MVINKKKKLVIVINLLLLVIMAVGVAFAFFNYSTFIDSNNSVNLGQISFSYNEGSNGIMILNATGITDEAGKLISQSNVGGGVIQGYFDFAVSATTTNDIDYEIYVTPDASNSLDPSYVKVYLTNNADVAYTGYTGVVPLFNSLTASTYDNVSKVLYTSKLTSEDVSHNYRLRIWVSDSFVLQSDSLTFKLNVYVRTI